MTEPRTWEELMAAMPRRMPRDVLDLGPEQWDLTWEDLVANGTATVAPFVAFEDDDV